VQCAGAPVSVLKKNAPSIFCGTKDISAKTRIALGKLDAER
jgi:hypothetical protein